MDYGPVETFSVVLIVKCLVHICSYHENKHSPADLKNFWIVNDSFFISSFLPILKDIRRFVLMSGETVVIDIGHFPIG